MRGGTSPRSAHPKRRQEGRPQVNSPEIEILNVFQGDLGRNGEFWVSGEVTLGEDEVSAFRVRSPWTGRRILGFG